MKTSPHLHFQGNCREAFDFYARTLGGKIAVAMTFGETPMAAKCPPEVRDQIVHARLELADQLLLGCDATADCYKPPQGFHVAALVESPAKAERVFAALADRGAIAMPFQVTFWSAGFGMCTDRFGIPWMVNCEQPPAA